MNKPVPTAKARAFQVLSIYISPPGDGQAHYYDFFRACGYNALEFCEGGFAQRPDRLTAYYAKMTQAVMTAQKKGFKVWILLLAGMKQWKGPAEQGSAGTFSARDAGLLEERLSHIRQAVQALRRADGFEFFAGDPGGDPEGRSNLQDCIGFARRVREIVREDAPGAGFVVNLWAIGEWAGFPSPFSLEFWKAQVALSKAVANDPGLLGPECGVVFSLDNYYRSLTLACFNEAGEKPELYPTAADVQRLHARGVRPVFGWPYFLVDEVDDGFITPNNVVSGGQSQAETRYIRAILDRGRELGLDGMVANAAFVADEPLNIYAFARMAIDPRLTPVTCLDEYAGIVADDATKRTLAQLLRFIENHSNWENSLPPTHRLPPLACDIPTAQAARERLALVRPRAKPSITLPEPPASYLDRLRKRLEAIDAGQIGGVAPIVPSGKKTP